MRIHVRTDPGRRPPKQRYTTKQQRAARRLADKVPKRRKLMLSSTRDYLKTLITVASIKAALHENHRLLLLGTSSQEGMAMAWLYPTWAGSICTKLRKFGFRIKNPPRLWSVADIPERIGTLQQSQYPTQVDVIVDWIQGTLSSIQE